jgi:multidrug efflux pump subunit AcrB
MVKFLIQRPIAVTVILIAFLVMSLIAARLIPVSLMPEIDIPEIVVKINAPGKPAREVEEQLVSKIRRQLLQVSHLNDIESSATNGQGSIRLIFGYGTNINYAFIEVNEKIDALMHSLPEEFTRPRVIKTSATDIPVFYLNVSLKDTLDENRFMELSQFCDQVIKKRVEQLPEVSMADISGLEYPEIVLQVDMDRLNQLGIDRSTLINALETNNYSVGNIKVRSGLYEYNVRYASLLTNRTDIENLYIHAGDRIFRLKDLAAIYIRPAQQKGVYLSGNSRAVVMAVIKKPDARIAALKEKTNKLVAQLQLDYPRLKISVDRNQTELLDYSLGNLWSGLIVGGMLAFFIMFLFMKDIKSPLLIGISVPLSLAVSLLLFYFAGISINVISLSGLILGVGNMIDNSIIVVDNIAQYRDKGDSVFKACIKGTNEVIRPLISSVLTSCAVFLSGISGALFYDQAMAVTIGLTVSLLVSVTLIPVYFRLFYKESKQNNEHQLHRMNWVNRIGIYRHIEDSYSRGFNFVFRCRKLFFSLAILFIVAGYFVFVKIEKEKFPVFKQTEAIFNIDWNRNIIVAENQKRLEIFLNRNNALIQNSSCMVGGQDFLLDISENQAARESQLYLMANNEMDLSRLIEAFTAYCKINYAEAIFKIIPPPTLFDKVFNNRSAPLEIRLKNKDALSLPDPQLAQEIIEKVTKKTGIRMKDRLRLQEYYTIVPDYERLLLYKVPVNEVISELKKALNQFRVFTLKQGQFEVPVFLSGQEKPLEQIIRTVRVKSETNEFIPLSWLVTVRNGIDYTSIQGGKTDVYLPLKYEVAANDAKMIKAAFDEILPAYPQTEFEVRGSLVENETLFGEMLLILLVSLLLLYFILAAQFESLLQPLIILIEIPIDIAAALILLWVTGNSLNLMAFIGIIVLTGIVINDSILKIDTINRLARSNVRYWRQFILAENAG